MSNIVLIEDDQLLRDLLVECLSVEGYCVQPRANGEPACPGDPADLVIVDLFMPRHEGEARLQAIKRQYPQAPVLAIAGQFRPGLDGSSLAATALGVRHVIAKPFSRGDLLSAVLGLVGPGR